MRSRSVIPSRERCTKRAVSCASWPNAFTTRSAPSASCTTARAVLSSFFTRRDWRRIRGRYTRDRKNSGGQIVKATSASCRTRGDVTTQLDPQIELVAFTIFPKTEEATSELQVLRELV